MELQGIDYSTNYAKLNRYLLYIFRLYIYHISSCVTLHTYSFSQLFLLAHTHLHTNTGRLHPPLNLADLSSRAESRCTCVLFPGLNSQGLQCTSAWVHLLVHTRRTFACIVINSICGGSPRLQGYGWIVKKANVSNIYSLICWYSPRALVNYFFMRYFLLLQIIQKLLFLYFTNTLWYAFVFKVYICIGIIQK